MTNSITYRLQQVLLEKKCSVNKLSQIAGLSQSALNKQMRGDASVSLKTIESVLNMWPDVSAEWLLREKGEMFKSEGNTQVNYGNNSVQAIGSSVSTEEHIGCGIAPLYDTGYLALDEKANAVARVSNTNRIMRPVIPEQLFRQPGQDIYNFLIDHKDGLDYEPNVAQFCEYTATATVSTDSLSPEVRRGDKIAVKLMPTLEIINGEMYLITDKNKGAILRYCTDKGDYFRCVSLNGDRYEEMHIKKENITSVWQVVGALKIYL